MLMRYFPHDYVDLWDKITYTSGVLGKNIAHGLITVLILFYCVQSLDLNFSFLLSSYLTSLVCESLFALLLGMAFDNSKNQLGKYKQWLTIGTCSSLAFSALFLLIPRVIQHVVEAYLAFVFIIINCSFLFIQLPYLALISSFSSNSHTRNLTATIPSVGNFLGRQFIFIGILVLLTPFKAIEHNLNTYLVLLGIAATILMVSQGSFIYCIRRHQSKWHEKTHSPATTSPSYTSTLGSNKAYAEFSNVHVSSKDVREMSAAEAYQALQNTQDDISQSYALSHTYAQAMAQKTQAKTQILDNKYSANQSYNINSQEHDTPSISVAAAAGVTDVVDVTNTDKANESNKVDTSNQVDAASKSGTSAGSIDSSATNSSVKSAVNSGSATNFDASDASNGSDGSAVSNSYAGSNGTYVSAVTDSYAGSDKFDGSNASTSNDAPAADISTNLTTVFTNNSTTNSTSNISSDSSSTSEQNVNATKANAAENASNTNRYQSFSRYNNLQSYSHLEPRYNNNNPAVLQAGYGELTSENQRQNLTLKQVVQVFIHNDQLMIMFIIGILQYANFSMMTSLLSSFFIENKFANNAFTAFVLIMGAVCQLVSMLYFPQLAKGSRRTRVFINASICTSIVFILHSLLPGLHIPMLQYFLPFLYFILNFSMGLSKVAMTTMVADTVDYGEFKLSLRTDAVVFAYFSSAYRVGTLISFSIFFADDMEHILTPSVENLMPLPIEMTIDISLICVMVAVALLLYKWFYKLNGAFYRNVLNNLQFLRQNQRAYDSNLSIQKHFMLRYSLDANAMLIKLKAKNESELIQAMVQKLSEVNAITSEHDYMCDLKARLAIGPCGIAEGIAIPHTKSSAVKRATVVVATLDTPIDLGALDGQNCDLIFLLASPDDGVTHMNLLGRLSLLLNEPGFADRLRTSGSPTELFERLVKCEKNIVN